MCQVPSFEPARSSAGRNDMALCSISHNEYSVAIAHCGLVVPDIYKDLVILSDEMVCFDLHPELFALDVQLLSISVDPIKAIVLESVELEGLATIRSSLMI